MQYPENVTEQMIYWLTHLIDWEYHLHLQLAASVKVTLFKRLFFLLLNIYAKNHLQFTKKDSFHTRFNALLLTTLYNHCNLIAWNEIIICHICLQPSWKPFCLLSFCLKSCIFYGEKAHICQLNQFSSTINQPWSKALLWDANRAGILMLMPKYILARWTELSARRA